MRVRFLQSIAGTRVDYYAGEEVEFVDLPSDVAAFLSVPLADGTFRAERIDEARRHQPELAAARLGARRIAGHP